MTWDGLAAVCAAAALAGGGVGWLMSRSRREGKDEASVSGNERRIEKLEHDVDELEKRVRHAQQNIVMLDERTTVIGRIGK